MHNRILIHRSDGAGERRPGEDTIERARGLIHQVTREALAETVALTEKLVARNPDKPVPHQLLAISLAYQAFFGFAPDWREKLDRAQRLVRRAVALDSASEFGHLIDGTIASLRREYRRARVAFERSLEINPNLVYATANLAMACAWAGDSAEAIRLAEAAMRTYPGDPAIFLRQFTMGLGHFLAGRPTEAHDWVLRSLQQRHECLPAQLLRIACCGALGDRAGAAAGAAELREMFPELGADALERMPFVRDGDRRSFVEALQKGGLALAA